MFDSQIKGLGMLEVGDTAHIVFYDHVEGCNNLSICSVYGVISQITLYKVVVEGWRPHESNQVIASNDLTQWAIARGTILSVFKLSEQLSELS